MNGHVIKPLLSSSLKSVRSSVRLTSAKRYNGLETPSYQVLEIAGKKHTKYELRRYTQSKWTSTTVREENLDRAGSKAFRPLFNYISGSNQSGNKVSMTSPVTMKVDGKTSDRIISFYLPPSNQNEPPVPTDDSVFTEKREQLNVYVRTFSGRASSNKWLKQAETLRKDLKEDGIKDFDRSAFYAVTYDSPFRLWKRRNEIWIKSSTLSMNAT